jgi:hypothetical protein
MKEMYMFVYHGWKLQRVIVQPVYIGMWNITLNNLFNKYYINTGVLRYFNKSNEFLVLLVFFLVCVLLT